MPLATHKLEPLVNVTRQQFLTKEETRIRSLASNVLASKNPDPAVRRWLNAVLYAEDINDIHDIAREKYERTGPPHHAESHASWAAQAAQLKLLALDQLAHLLL